MVEQEPGDRRKFGRINRNIDFYCYVDGQRFDSESLDVSAGGAFLRTGDDIRTQAAVVMVPRGVTPEESPVLLVGKVVRKQKHPPAGVGIKWSKAVARHGIHCILNLPQSIPELFERELPSPPVEIAASRLVAYDFRNHSYFIPMQSRVAGAEATKSKPTGGTAAATSSQAERQRLGTAKTMEMSVADLRRRHGGQTKPAPSAAPPSPAAGKKGPAPEASAVMPQRPVSAAPASAAASKAVVKPPSYKKSAEPGPLTNQLTSSTAQIPIDIPVKLVLDKATLEGTALTLGMTNIFVACNLDLVRNLGSGDTVQVVFPIKVQPATVTLTLDCRLFMMSRDLNTDAPGLALQIVGHAGAPTPGLFERYVKYLYYRMVAE